jgi:hypothetical protein
MLEVVQRLLDRWCRRTALPLLFYALLGTVLLSPLVSPIMPESAAQDLANHVSGIIEGRNALDEHQFPIRVAPNQNERHRYPIFQFYGNLPYTLGGWLCRTFHLDPYTSFKVALWLSLMAGGFFTYRCALLLTRRAFPALAAGAVFLTAPYMLTDIHARFAFPETVSFNLLPVVLYANLRCLTSRRLAPVLCTGIAWCLLGLSHNIAFFYASLFIAAMHLAHIRWRKRALVRLLRAGAGYGLGLILLTWYIAPQIHTLPAINIGNCVCADQVSSTNWITPLGILLAPGLTLPSPFPTPMDNPRFGVQVGWPILAAVALCVYQLWLGARRRDWMWWLMLRLCAAVAVSFFMVWSPLDFWQYLPRMFYFVQFTYRLLMFVVLFGSLLAACALTRLFPGGMRFEHLAVCVCLAGYATTPYLGHHPASRINTVAAEMYHPDIGRGGANGAYRLFMNGYLFANVSPYGVNLARPGPGRDVSQLSSQGILSGLPRPTADDQLIICGTVLKRYQTPLRLQVFLDDILLGEKILESESFSMALPVATPPKTDPCSIRFRTRPCPNHSDSPSAAGEGLAVCVDSVAIVPLVNGEKALFLPASEALKTTVLSRETFFHLDNRVPAVVQLPVMYYPDLLRVSDNGESIPYGNLEEMVAVQLPPGKHVVTVRFEGLRWANVISLLGCVTTGLLLLVSQLRSRRSLLIRLLSAAQVRKRLVGGVVPGIVVLLSLGWGVQKWRERHHPSCISCRVTASGSLDAAHSGSRAFDGDPGTAWIAMPIERSLAALTIVPSRAAALDEVTLVPRLSPTVEGCQGWKKVEAVFYLKGTVVSIQEFATSDAARLRRWQLGLLPVVTDRFELFFREPITETASGEEYNEAEIRPGLAEVELHWQ